VGDRRTEDAVKARLLAGLVVLFEPVADGHQQTIDRNNCTIRITAVGPYHTGTSPVGAADPGTEQSRADVQTIKDAIEAALAASMDMQTKVDAACDRQNDGIIDILVFRNSAEVNFGNANPSTGTIRVDLGDTPLLSGNSTAVATVRAAKLTRTLAHEFDHLRDQPGEDHEDPGGEAAGLTTGPAVDDENLVISQMNFPVHRRSFYVAYVDNLAVSGYAVDTDGDGLVDASVTWRVELSTRVAGPAGQRVIDPGLLDGVPTQWEPIQNYDFDLDGSDDLVDVCMRAVNPQQGRDCLAAVLWGNGAEALGLVASTWQELAIGEAVTHSDGVQTAIPEAAQEIAAVSSFAVDLDAAALLPCGLSQWQTSFCASVDPPPTGPWLVVQLDLAAAFPIDDGERSYQYAVVFDADGDPSNNYQADPNYPNDFFVGTDRWYVLSRIAGQDWSLDVTDLDGTLTASDARVVVTGSEFALLIPASEFSAASPGYRVTAFRHTGDYGLAGGPWSADYHPRVGEPLLVTSTANPIPG
jgi:hypothetical protein